MLLQYPDEITCNTISPFLGDPMDMMDHANSADDNTKNDTFSQAPMFTAEQLQSMHQQFQQRSSKLNPNQPSGFITETHRQSQQDSTQQHYSTTTNDAATQNWMQLIQPTPFGDNVHNQQFAIQSSNNRDMHSMLQQLFQENQNLDSSMGDPGQNSTSLFTLGSTVEPMHHRTYVDSNQDESDFFKGMWDVDDIDILGSGKPSFESIKAPTKRKFMNGDATNLTSLIAPQLGRRQYEPFQNQGTQQVLGILSFQADQSFPVQTDAMDDSDDFPSSISKPQCGHRNIRAESPMSTCSSKSAPPPTTLSSSGMADILQQPSSRQQKCDDSNIVSISEEDYAFLLPSTLLPPSVMTSVLPPGFQTGPHSKGPTSGSGGGRYKKKKGSKSTRVESPLDALQRILSMQGYGPIKHISAEDAHYETVPSPLQLASFGTELVKAIHTSDTHQLSKLLETGLSPNPCNKFRDSMVDLVCKRANGEVFKCLVNHGCDLRVCDGFGRTPLHHCCWANEFSADIAETILEIDWLQLFIEDKRGQIPLEYIRPDQAAEWVEFLEDNRQRFFPIGGKIPAIYPVKISRPDNILPDPANSLPVELASAISSGRLTPDELANMDPASRANFRY